MVQLGLRIDMDLDICEGYAGDVVDANHSDACNLVNGDGSHMRYPTIEMNSLGTRGILRCADDNCKGSTALTIGELIGEFISSAITYESNPEIALMASCRLCGKLYDSSVHTVELLQYRDEEGFPHDEYMDIARRMLLLNTVWTK